MLALVGLAGFEKRRISSLSGGQQQRVAIARALINKPDVLLLDEPLGALDLKLRREMQLELKRIQRESGITFIFVTHDQEEALTMSDRVAVMSAGHILQLGTPEEKSVLLQHLLLSHHGEPEFGAAVLPQCAEGELLSLVDQIDSRMEIYREVLQPMKPGEFSQRVFALDNRRVYKHE